jgi:hypothetical protein
MGRTAMNEKSIVKPVQQVIAPKQLLQRVTPRRATLKARRPPIFAEETSWRQRRLSPPSSPYGPSCDE